MNPLSQQTSIPIGKYAPFPQTLIDIDGFYVKGLNRHFLIGGDDTGCLNFIELGHDWHVCNDVTEYQGYRILTLKGSPLSSADTQRILLE